MTTPQSNGNKPNMTRAALAVACPLRKVIVTLPSPFKWALEAVPSQSCQSNPAQSLWIKYFKIHRDRHTENEKMKQRNLERSKRKKIEYKDIGKQTWTWGTPCRCQWLQACTKSDEPSSNFPEGAKIAHSRCQCNIISATVELYRDCRLNKIHAHHKKRLLRST